MASIVLIHFTASWAEAICGPHRVEVRKAADLLHAGVRDLDVDEMQEEAEAYSVMQVPSVAIEGDTSTAPIPGAVPCARLVVALRERLGDGPA